MFWIPIFAVATTLSLIKLGALAGWVQILSLPVAAAAAVNVAGLLALLARSLLRRFRRT